jgi:hypothetical protein
MSAKRLRDRAICLHEAAHAVTAEVLRPGCVIAIEMDYVGGTPTVVGMVYGGDVEAVCSWEWWNYGPDCFTALAAGRVGERIVEFNDERFDVGDSDVLREVATPDERRVARRRAESLVRRHELAIRRVAAALGKRRFLTGVEVRELMA